MNYSNRNKTQGIAGEFISSIRKLMSRIGLLVILPGFAPAQHSVSLIWTASTSPNVVGYRVYRGTMAGGPYVLLNSSPVVGFSYADSTVQDGQTYYYVGTAVDNNNGESVYSNEAQAVVPGANPQPLTVTNNASNQPGPIAPGELITIKGTLLGPTTPVSYTVNEQGTVNAALAGVRVLFDGLPGTMIYASAMQLNVTVPWEIAGRLTTNVVVENNGVQSAPINLGLTDVAPGIYTRDSTGLHQAAALNQDNTINGTTPGTSPAGQGQTVVLYATGCGVTDPPGVTGSVSPSNPLLWVQGSVSLTVGAQTAQVLFIGASPANLTGICQVNAQLPAGVTGTSLPVVLSINGVSSPVGPTIAVQ